MEPMIMGVSARNYDEALKQVQKWIDTQMTGSGHVMVTFDNKETKITLPDGRVGIARCNPCDKFDIITGIRVALDDIEKKSRKLTDEEKMYLKVAKKAGAEYVVRKHFAIFKDDIYFTYDVDDDYDDVENYALTISDDEVFSWLEDEKFYDIDTLLKERG